ncbi:hypothetical protein Tco_1430046 [Tanacetum coccineum]
MPHAGVLILFIILSDSNDEVTTLPVRPAPPSPDYVLASPNYSLDSDLDSDPLEDDSPDGDLNETAESLHTQTVLTSVVHPPPSLLPSSSSPPPSLFPSSSSRKRSRSPSPLPPPIVPLSPPAQETVTLRARVELLEQHDMVTQDSLRIDMGRITRLQLQAVYAEYEALELRDFWVIDRLKILELHNRAEYAETRLERSHDRPTGDGVRTKRAVMTEREVEAQRARAEAAE